MQAVPTLIWKSIAIIVGILVCAALTFFFMQAQQNDKVALQQRISGSELTQMKEAYIALIKTEGAARAYTLFLEAAPQNTAVNPHEHAHVFGEALYAVEGIEGVQFCDSSFEFGCYHSFFGMAVYEQGIGVLPKFDQACRDAHVSLHLPCQHGIGHGVLVYSGYDMLEEALALCETISWQETGGCSSGVFMEYNFHTMETVSNEGYIRPLEDDVYAPCNTLSERYQMSCYLEQVQWWENIFKHDYKKIGTLCAAVPGAAANGQACFHGVGNYVAAYTKLDPQHIASLCGHMPDQHSTALCHEGASWLVRDLRDMEFGKEVCTLSPEAFQDACMQKL